MSGALTAIGLTSGPALDGIDAALLKTDGELAVEPGPVLHFPFDRDLRVALRRAIKAAFEGRDGAADIGKAAGELTAVHVEAVEGFLDKTGLKRDAIDVVGFHGQTILHRPAHAPGELGRSWQIGDGAVLARETRIDVVCDFRSADIAAGGEGAPLRPVYHWALVNSARDTLGCDGPVGVVDLGGAVNVTYVAPGSRPIDLVAFDSGPGNALINEWVELKTGEATDADGALARKGAVHTDILRMMLLNPYMRRHPPKSLDRYDFKLDPVLNLSTADGAATLTAFAAACVRASDRFLPAAPQLWILSGGGRRNPALVEAIEKAVSAPAIKAEDAGWRGDDLEAESIAYLAVRSLKKLPLSYPRTTRVARPMPGGVFHRAPL